MEKKIEKKNSRYQFELPCFAFRILIYKPPKIPHGRLEKKKRNVDQIVQVRGEEKRGGGGEEEEGVCSRVLMEEVNAPVSLQAQRQPPFMPHSYCFISGRGLH